MILVGTRQLVQAAPISLERGKGYGVDGIQVEWSQDGEQGVALGFVFLGGWQLIRSNCRVGHCPQPERRSKSDLIIVSGDAGRLIACLLESASKMYR